jgi:hypothetical protein
MRLERPKVALILTDDERVRLDSSAHRSRTAPHVARRARIILACAEGHDNKAVCEAAADVADHRLQMARPRFPTSCRESCTRLGRMVAECCREYHWTLGGLIVSLLGC